MPLDPVLLRWFLTAILGGVLAGICLSCLTLGLGLVLTARMRRETAQLIGNIQATTQAILASVRHLER